MTLNNSQQYRMQIDSDAQGKRLDAYLTAVYPQFTRSYLQNLIKNGKIDVPIKGATLIGNGPEVMNLVSMVGNDLKFDAGIGTCGKNGQSVAVGIGQPTLKVDALTVGGTQA